MDRLKMQTANKADENFKKLAQMFPDAVTETVDENGEVVRAIDKDVLMQEISCKVVEGREERYQFTWPDKKKSVLLANAPINKTLRPCREESVDFDTTENLYIEGDNLEVLKLLQETYLGKIKMIYIDPPYNTGRDLLYTDDFSQSIDEYLACSGQFDDEGNKLFTNTGSNGRFHTDWLNMIYPRLKLAKDLLRDDGIIFISIDDNEQENLRKIGDEVFGEENFLAQMIWKSKPQGGNDNPHIVPEHEYILVYCKKYDSAVTHGRPYNEDKYKNKDEYYETRGGYFLGKLDLSTLGYRPNLDYAILAPDGTEIYPGGVSKEEKLERERRNANNTNDWRWRWSKGLYETASRNGFIVIKKNSEGKWGVYAKEYQNVDRDGNLINRELKYRTVVEDVTTVDGTSEMRNLLGNRVFPFPKPTKLLKQLIKIGADNDSIVMDFFSGSASTAHAVMQANAEDGGHRKFIMVQLPEPCDEKSEACRAGYKNICEIGKERIRRAGRKIENELPPPAGANLDIGFRVLKCDTSNMKDVYYNPSEVEPSMFDLATDNIKNDRTAEDLLFQVMLDLGVLLSSKIEQITIAGKKVFSVADGFLIACFDSDVTEDVIKEIALKKPYYFVMRDSSMANDSVATNFEQIFATYSPDTVRRVL